MKSIEYALSLLNSFHKKVKFTYEIENGGQLPFLDVLLCKNDKKIITTVYQKETQSNVYLYCDSTKS